MNICICMNMNMYIYIYICIFICIFICMYMYTYFYIYMCVYSHIYIYILCRGDGVDKNLWRSRLQRSVTYNLKTRKRCPCFFVFVVFMYVVLFNGTWFCFRKYFLSVCIPVSKRPGVWTDWVLNHLHQANWCRGRLKILHKRMHMHVHIRTHTYIPHTYIRTWTCTRTHVLTKEKQCRPKVW